MDDKPEVLNCRRDAIPEDAVYVGRPTKWGNPFKDDTRDANIAAYKVWLRGNAELMASIHELKGKDLVCWCAPLPCHADVLLELANPEEE